MKNKYFDIGFQLFILAGVVLIAGKFKSFQPSPDKDSEDDG